MARDKDHYSREESLLPGLEMIGKMPGMVLCPGFQAAAEGFLMKDQGSTDNISCTCRSCTDIKAYVEGNPDEPLVLPISRSRKHEKDVVERLPEVEGKIDERKRLVVTKIKNYKKKRREIVKKRAEELCRKLTGGAELGGNQAEAGPSDGGESSRAAKRAKRGKK